MARVDEKDFKVMGKSFPRKDGPDMVTGRFKHVGDIQLPGMLHGRYLCSPHAHADIVSIDVSAAKALPGVRAVLTYKDIGDVAMTKVSSGNMFPLSEKARAVGDAIAAVAADTADIAEEALDLIKVQYKVLPHVVDPREAMKPGAPEIHAKDHGLSKQPGNFYSDTDAAQYGNREEGVKASDKVFEFSGYMSQSCSNHNSSRRAAVAYWESDDRLKIWTESQGVFEDRANIAKDLGKFIKIPQSGVRVLCECAGGGFGSNKMGRHPYIATLLSLAAGKRPVKVDHSRRLELGFEAYGRTRTYTQSLKVGIKSNGDLTFADWHNIQEQGAYSQDGTRKMVNAWATHKLDNAWEKAQAVYTNTGKAGWKRGVAGPICEWPTASALDQIAESLGKNPWDYLYQIMADDYDHSSGTAKRPWISNLTREALNRALAASNMKTKWKGWKTPVSVNGPRKRGIGLAIGRQYSGNSSGGGIARLIEDGTIRYEIGVTNTGQGAPSTQSQVLAEAVGVTYDMVSVRSGDTDFPQNPRSAGSTMATSTGRASKATGEKLKKVILDDWAAPLFKVKPGELEMEEGVIWVKADPTKKMTLREATNKFWGAGTNFAQFPIIEAAVSTPPVLGVSAASFGVYIAEVEVDTDTGLVDVINAWSAQDCGRPISPHVCLAQSEGGWVEGIDMALYEDRIWDPQSGVALMTDWLGYMIPTYLDMPQEWKPQEWKPLEWTHISLFVKPDDPNCEKGPYGAKGFAEGCSECVHPAIGNAIYNAVGVRLKELPMTPDLILKALGKG